MDIYYSGGWNIYWERIAVYLSAQRTRVSNACNTDFRLFVILGDKSIRLVRLCLQVKTFRFNKRLCFVTICLSRQALIPVFESAVLCAFINSTHTNEMVPYYLNKLTDTFETHINPLSKAR